MWGYDSESFENILIIVRSFCLVCVSDWVWVNDTLNWGSYTINLYDCTLNQFNTSCRNVYTQTSNDL